MLNTHHNSTYVRMLNISKYTSVENSKFRKRLFTAIYFATLFIHNYIFYKSLLYLKSVIHTYKRRRRRSRKHKHTLLFRFMHRSVYTIAQNLSKTTIYLSSMTKEYSLIRGNKLLSKRALKIIGSIRN